MLGRARRFDAPLRRRNHGSTAATRSSAVTCRSPSDWHWPIRSQHRRAVTACFFGEGAMAEGEFHEAINLAALWNLPVLFCCENNRYAMGTSLETSESQVDLALKARGIRDPGVGGRRDGPVGGAPCRPPRRRRDRVRRRAGLPRIPDLPVPGSLDVRPGPVPGPGRDRAMEAARPDRHARPVARRRRSCSIDADLDALWERARTETDQAVAAADAAPLEPVDGLARPRHRSRATDDRLRQEHRDDHTLGIRRPRRRGGRRRPTDHIPRGDAQRRSARRSPTTSA